MDTIVPAALIVIATAAFAMWKMRASIPREVRWEDQPGNWQN